MNRLNQSTRTLREQNTSLQVEVDFSALHREAEQDVLKYMRRKEWLGRGESELSIAEASVLLLKHLPEIIQTVPNALCSSSVYRTLLWALQIVQHPYMKFEPETGPVTNLILLADQASRLPARTRPFVRRDDPVVAAALLALKAAAVFLNSPPIRKTVLGDLSDLVKKRARDSHRGSRLVMDEVAALLGYEGSAVTTNHRTKRANSLNSMLRRGRMRRRYPIAPPKAVVP